MKKLLAGIFCIGIVGLSGCAEILSITTPDEIRKSTFQRETISTNSSTDVTNCMKETLLSYKNDQGKASYAGITFRDFEKIHDITLRTGGSTSLAGSEILFLIENSDNPAGGTRSHLWTHQHLIFFGGSQGFFDRVYSVIRPCINETVVGTPSSLTKLQNVKTEPISATNPTSGGRSKEDSINKLEQLKGLADRGVITREDFEKKKKEILDNF